MPTSSAAPAHGTLYGFPKRELSPLQRARVSLGLPVDARPKSNLARLLRMAGLGKTAIEYLKWCNDEEARRIVELYHSLNATERKAVTIDYLIMATGLDAHRVWGLIHEGVSRCSGFKTTLVVAASAPDVTRKAIERALTPQGHKDRELVLTMGGVLPTHPRRPGSRWR